MDILALDLSKSATGWARFRSGDSKPSYGTWKLGGPYTDRPTMMINLYKLILDAFAFGAPDLVIYESPLRGDAQSTEANNRNANAMCSIVEFVCKAKRVRCDEASNSTWRKVALGKGRGLSTKEFKAWAMAMAKEFGLKPENDNEADAIGLLDYALKQEGITPPWRNDDLLAGKW